VASPNAWNSPANDVRMSHELPELYNYTIIAL